MLLSIRRQGSLYCMFIRTNPEAETKIVHRKSILPKLLRLVFIINPILQENEL